MSVLELEETIEQLKINMYEMGQKNPFDSGIAVLYIRMAALQDSLIRTLKGRIK